MSASFSVGFTDLSRSVGVPNHGFVSVTFSDGTTTEVHGGPVSFSGFGLGGFGEFIDSISPSRASKKTGLAEVNSSAYRLK